MFVYFPAYLTAFPEAPRYILPATKGDSEALKEPHDLSYVWGWACAHRESASVKLLLMPSELALFWDRRVPVKHNFPVD